MKLLILTSEPISARQLRNALPDDVDLDRTEVMLVAPALQESGIRFWVNDVDEAIARARTIEEESVQSLDREGVTAHGDTGESDPVQAIQDALQTFPADRILVFMHPGSDTRYREDLDVNEIEEMFGRPVARATVSA
jgi:hypothetical protein